MKELLIVVRGMKSEASVALILSRGVGSGEKHGSPVEVLCDPPRSSRNPQSLFFREIDSGPF
jgi:hypothetical protein